MQKLKLSIITPCLNAEKSIRRAINSVLVQNYKNWEHIVVDGGSTDGTLAILSEYQHLKIISGPDNGQADAMNKGAAVATGDVIGFLNADDFYFPDAFQNVLLAFDAQTELVMGNVLVRSARRRGAFLNKPKIALKDMLRHWEPNAFCYNPVGYFYRTSVQKRCPFNVSNRESMDLEFLLAAAAICDFKKIEFTLGCFEDGLDTVTDRTQLRPDYWRPSRFRFVDSYKNIFSPTELARYQADRRKGYIRLQNESNWNARKRGKCLALDIKENDGITVVIPVLHELLDTLDIRARVNSIISQLPAEIVVLTEKTFADRIAAELGEHVSDRRVRVCEVDKLNSSWAIKNASLECATGNFIYFSVGEVGAKNAAISHLLSIAVTCNVDIVQAAPLRKGARENLKFRRDDDFASDGGIDGLEFLALGKCGLSTRNKLYSRKLLERVGELGLQENTTIGELIFTARTAFLANGIVSVSDPLVKYRSPQKSAAPDSNVYDLMVSYFKSCRSLEKALEEFDLDSDTVRRLAARILLAKGNSDFGSRLIRLYSQIGPQAFNAELQVASRELLGANVDSISALIQFLVEEVVRASDDDKPMAALFNTWRYVRDNASRLVSNRKSFRN